MSYETSESVAKIAPALIAAQATVGGAAKSADNSHLSSKYAPLDEVWAAAKEPLQENDLAVTQHPVSDEGSPGLRTVLWHKSGEWIASEIFVTLHPTETKAGKTIAPGPQQVGALVTYLRRYALQSLLGICPEDTDAELVSGSMSRTFSFAIQAAEDLEQLREVARAIQERVRGKQRDALVREWNEKKKTITSAEEVEKELLADIEGAEEEDPPEFELTEDGEPIPPEISGEPGELFE